MEKKSSFWDRPIGISAVVCGLAFGTAAAIYAAVPALSRFLYAFYMGYFLTVAKGADLKNFKFYVSCLFCGFIWLIPYWFGTDWLMALGLENLVFGRFVTEFILNTALVYIHLHLLRKTWACIPPFIFVSITSVFASGGIENWPYCALSLFLGMTFCMLANKLSDILIARKNP